MTLWKRMLSLCFLPLAAVWSGAASADQSLTLSLWPGQVPGPAAQVTGEERDMTKAEDHAVAGDRVMRLGNVSVPQIEVFLPAAKDANGGAVVVCPGGGFNILAWDLEGTEAARWLNSLGFAAILLKYRVPTGGQGDDAWRGPAIDAQRAISLTRANAGRWGIDPKRVGVMGFSAGGKTAAMAAFQLGERLYEAVDDSDVSSCAADFALLIYPAYLVNEAGGLREGVAVTGDAPPMFLAHTADDPVTCMSSVAVFGALKKAGVSAELHVFATGGHGYGLRRTDAPVTAWTDQAATWLGSWATGRPVADR
jgi:acetyl esterase/lipase